jgi:hypothetical protein
MHPLPVGPWTRFTVFAALAFVIVPVSGHIAPQFISRVIAFELPRQSPGPAALLRQ